MTSEDVPVPWVGRLSDAELAAEVGPGVFARGAAYRRAGMVTSLSTGGGGRVLLGEVKGSAGRGYHTVVTAEGDIALAHHPLHWTSRCSCPMQRDCKHVVALLLTARNELTPGTAVPGRRWEAAFAAVLRNEPAEADARPLALHVEVATARSSGYAEAREPVPRLRLRPVTAGANGTWIRTGASWRELEYGYGAARLDPAQREWMLALLATARVHDQRAYYAEQYLTADQLGPRLWGLLGEAAQVGVRLVTGRKGQAEVRLADEPAAVVLDARREAADGGLLVLPGLRVPGAADAGDRADELRGLVGEPPHGVFVQRGDHLLLAALDRPLDSSMVDLVSGGAVHIPAADVPRFLSRYYPALRQRAEVRSSDASIDFPEIRPPTLAVSVRFEAKHRVLLRWSFQYRLGAQLVSLPIVGAGEGHPRDRPAEAALLAGLDVLDVVPGLRVVVGTEKRLVPEQRLGGLQTVAFVREVLPVLTERDDVAVTVEGAPLPYVEATDAPVITVSASDPGETGEAGAADWFDLGITVTVGGEAVPFAPLFAALARGDGHLLLDTGTWFSLDRPELHALRRLIEEARSLQDRESQTLRVTRWHAGLWEELVSLGVVAHQSERWSRTVGALLGLDSVPAPASPSGLRATLRAYQLEGFQWLSMLWDHQLGGILADDMGLGKTLQTLAMAARAHELGTLTPEAPLLIVAPTSVVSAWQQEAARFCPDLVVATVTETRKRSGQALSSVIAGAHVVVTSFALLRLDEDAFRALPWSGLVLDEAQFVKNHQAKTYQVARRLPAPFKLAITGTPLENSLMDLWALLSIVAPGLFPSPQRFTELYRAPIESGTSPELLSTLRRRIRPLMLRRTKGQVARDLPPKIEQLLSVQLNPQHRRVYDRHLQRERQRVLGMLEDVDRNRMAILRSLTVLRQLSLAVSLVDQAAGAVPSSKIDALVEQLRELATEGHRALVFSQFTGLLRLVRERLDAEGLGHVYLDGRTRDRQARIARFRDGDAPVFLISLKAGGSGLTLTEADYVFVLDPWWNPATEAQAVDRTHRIGQDKTVVVYRMVAEGTVEEKVVALQQRKRDLFDRVVDGDGSLSAPLTADDIRGLLEVDEAG